MTDNQEWVAESPRKTTYLQVTHRKLSRAGQDSFDADELAAEYYNFQERRGSSQSISRYNSCPQLVEMEESAQEPYEKTVDDINTNTCALNRELKCVVAQPPTNVALRRTYLDNGQISDTPTPPSTPKSRRSYMSSRDSLLSSPEKTFVAGSPFASPRLLLRKQMVHSFLSTGSSESLTDPKSPLEPSKKPPLSVENVHKFEELKSTEDKGHVTGGEAETGYLPNKAQKHGSADHGDTETVNKCESWLKTLHIVQNDRIKSRSHIQLPPI